MIRVEVDRRGRVRLQADLDLPIDAGAAWQSLRDVRRFACMDLFHREMRLSASPPRAGVDFELEHELLGIRIVRVGRILHWHEGVSYAFSDLSRRGPRRGFPHVYTYTLIPLEIDRCRFRLEVRGLWTARFAGRALTRLWLGWILLKTATSIRNAILADTLDRRVAPEHVPGVQSPEGEVR